MNFELGKEYIIKVSEKGIIPIEEFESDRFYDKDHDNLDFLTDEEKIVVINNVLEKIRAEIIELRRKQNVGVLECLDIINKYRAEGEDNKWQEKKQLFILEH